DHRRLPFALELLTMNPNLKWKALFILVVIVLCIAFVAGMPNLPTSLTALKDNFAHQIKLGLDLQGGTHLILQVQEQEAIAQETDQTVDRLTTELRNKNIRYEKERRMDDTHIIVRNVPSDQLSQFRDIVNEQQYQGTWDLGSAPGQASAFLLTLRPSAISAIQESTMSQSLETIERRINALGLTEPTIQLHGRAGKDNEILVQLPGEGDPESAKSVIQAGGQLELKLVEDANPYPSEAAAMAAKGGILPAGTELLKEAQEARSRQNPNDTGENWLLVDRTPIVTGRDLRSATEN